MQDVDRDEDGALYIVMELLRGESLEERLERTQWLSVSQTLEVVTQVGKGLAVATGVNGPDTLGKHHKAGIQSLAPLAGVLQTSDQNQRERYQSTVLFKPSSKGTTASQSHHCLIRLRSRHLRGCPSGLEASKTSSPP